MNTETQLRNVGSLIGNSVETKDRDTCGRCSDCLFDEKLWVIRYVVVDTGGIFSHRELIISPFLFPKPEAGAFERCLVTKLTRDQIEHSPPLESDAPISRRYEWELARHYGYPVYWSGSAVWGYSPFPIISALDPSTRLVGPEEVQRHEEKMEEIGESHLRSCNEVMGYDVFCSEEHLGTIVDFILETKTWRIRHLIVRTGTWLSRKNVALSPEWVSEISWEDRCLVVTGMGRDKLVGAPEFHLVDGRDPDSP
jgi:uncharacterized protein YrrD